MTETENFKNSFLFENLMKRFDQSCEHLDMQIGKLNQKKRKAEENKNLDLIPTQTHPHRDLQENNNKTGDQSFDNVTVFEHTNENSTLDTKKRKIDEEEVIISNATTNQMMASLDSDLPLRKKRANKSQLKITNQIITDLSNINNDIKRYQAQVVLERNKVIDNLAEAYNLTKHEQVNELSRLEKSKELARDVTVNELTRLEKSKELTRDVKVNELSKHEKKQNDLTKYKIIDDLTRQKIIDDLTRIDEDKLTCQLCDIKFPFADKISLNKHNDCYHKDGTNKLDASLKQTKNNTVEVWTKSRFQTEQKNNYEIYKPTKTIASQQINTVFTVEEIAELKMSTQIIPDSTTTAAIITTAFEPIEGSKSKNGIKDSSGQQLDLEDKSTSKLQENCLTSTNDQIMKKTNTFSNVGVQNQGDKNKMLLIYQVPTEGLQTSFEIPFLENKSLKTLAPKVSTDLEVVDLTSKTKKEITEPNPNKELLMTISTPIQEPQSGTSFIVNKPISEEVKSLVHKLQDIISPTNTTTHQTDSRSVITAPSLPIQQTSEQKKEKNSTPKKYPTGVQSNLGFKCTRCREVFTYAFQQQRHMDVVHNKLKYHMCSMCNSSFSYLNLFQWHIKNAHN